MILNLFLNIMCIMHFNEGWSSDPNVIAWLFCNQIIFLFGDSYIDSPKILILIFCLFLNSDHNPFCFIEHAKFCICKGFYYSELVNLMLINQKPVFSGRCSLYYLQYILLLLYIILFQITKIYLKVWLDEKIF